MPEPTRITDLTPIETDAVSDTDEFVIIDRSDNTQADSGTGKRINAKNTMAKMFVEDNSYPVDWPYGHPMISVLFGGEAQRPQSSDNWDAQGERYLLVDGYPPTTATFYENQGTVIVQHNTDNVLRVGVDLEATVTIGNGSPWYVIWLDEDTNTAWVEDSNAGSGSWVQHTTPTYLEGAGAPVDGVTDGLAGQFYWDTDNDDLWYCTDADADTWSITASDDGEFEGSSAERFVVGSGDPTAGNATWATGVAGDYYVNYFLNDGDNSQVWVCTGSGPPAVWSPNGVSYVTSELVEDGITGTPTGHGPGSMLAFICTDNPSYGGSMFVNQGTADAPIWEDLWSIGFVGF